MEYDVEKADEFALALLYFNLYRYGKGVRSWKNFPWDVLDSLHEKDLISDPGTKAKSFWVTEEGEKKAKEMFEKHLVPSLSPRSQRAGPRR
jgi:hypothetical protein